MGVEHSMSVTPYRGRFAPTPSGPLHFGSLLAAMASYLDARSHQGQWLLRIEDVDPPRVLPGAADGQIRTLSAYGFEWDEAIIWQRQRQEAYRAALDELQRQGQVYACTCSRKTLAQRARMGVDGWVYPGTCRTGALYKTVKEPAAWRLRVPDDRVVFDDAWQGRVACDVGMECGDFVLRRADQVFTYQLAVVVDDAAQGITHVVRGADLLPSTPRQIVLQAALGLSRPRYMHVPVALDGDGCKLSKQTHATPLSALEPLAALRQAADFLGLELVAVDSVAEFWQAALLAWPRARRQPIRGKRSPWAR